MTAYFPTEIALDPAIPTCSGGLRVLAGDTLRAAADRALPMVAVTHLHCKGYFRRKLDASGWQTEERNKWMVGEFLKELPACVSVNIEWRTVRLRVWQSDAEAEKQESVDIFQQYGVTAGECAPIVIALERKLEAWRDFMMRFELGLEEPNPKRAVRSAFTIEGAYIVGGLVPLAPYILMHDSGRALGASAVITLLALLAFGFVKGHSTGVPKMKGTLRAALVGSLAAGVAYAIGKFIA